MNAISIFSTVCVFIFCKNFIHYKTVAKSYILVMIGIGVLGIIVFFSCNWITKTNCCISKY